MIPLATPAERLTPEDFSAAPVEELLAGCTPEWFLDYLSPTAAERLRYFARRFSALAERSAEREATVIACRAAQGLAGIAGVERKAWDCQHFGVECAAIGPVCLGVDLHSVERHRILGVLLDAAIEWARERRIDILHRRLLADRMDEIRLLQTRGFRLVDAVVTLTAGTASSVQPPDVREVLPGDVPALLRIADGTFSESRFHHEPAFTAARADALYLRWVENAATRMADDAKGAGARVLVAEAGDVVAGFAIWRLNAELAPPLAQLDLFAVDAAMRGRGAGSRLLAAVKAAARNVGAPICEASTWVQQKAALATYRKSGFAVRETLFSFHLSL